MLEQKKPLMLGKNRGEPTRACVHGEQDLGLQGIRLQDPPPPFWWVAQRPPAPTGVLGSVEPSPSVHSGGESQ